MAGSWPAARKIKKSIHPRCVYIRFRPNVLLEGSLQLLLRVLGGGLSYSLQKFLALRRAYLV